MPAVIFTAYVLYSSFHSSVSEGSKCSEHSIKTKAKMLYNMNKNSLQYTQFVFNQLNLVLFPIYHISVYAFYDPYLKLNLKKFQTKSV